MSPVPLLVNLGLPAEPPKSNRGRPPRGARLCIWCNATLTLRAQRDYCSISCSSRAMAQRRSLSDGPRVAAPAGHVEPLRLRWPAEKHLAPSRCSNCGSRNLIATPPTVLVPVGDVTCFLCTRIACLLDRERVR